MGNSPSTEGEMFVTAAMAKYMTITKEQLMEVRDTCTTLRGSKDTINRRQFLNSLNRAQVVEYPDIDVLASLFTLYDDQGNNRVNCQEFLTGIAPLACRGQKLDQILQFVMVVYDLKGTKKIGNTDLVKVLKSISYTAYVFDDPVLTETQIYKIVDNVFGTLVGMTDKVKPMTHKECIENIMEESLVTSIYLKASSRVRFKNVPFYKTRLEGDESTIISSVFLTPLQQKADTKDEDDKLLFIDDKTPKNAVEVIAEPRHDNEDRMEPNSSSSTMSPPLRADAKVSIQNSLTHDSSMSKSRSLIPLTRIKVLTSNWSSGSSKNNTITVV